MEQSPGGSVYERVSPVHLSPGTSSYTVPYYKDKVLFGETLVGFADMTLAGETLPAEFEESGTMVEMNMADVSLVAPNINDDDLVSVQVMATLNYTFAPPKLATDISNATISLLSYDNTILESHTLSVFDAAESGVLTFNWTG